MKSRRFLIEISIAALAVLVMLWIFVPRFLRVQDHGMAKYFPDPAFRQSVKVFMGISQQNCFSEDMLDEMQHTMVKFTVKDCFDLHGLEWFPRLFGIDVESNSIKRIDLSPFQELMSIAIKAGSLEELDLLHMNWYSYLQLEFDLANRPPNTPFQLNVPDKNLLGHLVIKNYPNETLDLSFFDNLGYLSIDTITSGEPPSLKRIDLSGLDQLIRITIDGNQLPDISLVKQKKLKELYTSNGHSTEIIYATQIAPQKRKNTYERIER